MENCQQCENYICKCEVKEFIPQSVEKELKLCLGCNTMKNMEAETTECRQCFETSNTLGTTMEWEEELKASLRNRFILTTTIGENRYASDFLEEIVIPKIKDILSQVRQESYKQGKEDGFVEGANFTSAYKIARQETIKECIDKIIKAKKIFANTPLNKRQTAWEWLNDLEIVISGLSKDIEQ